MISRRAVRRAIHSNASAEGTSKKIDTSTLSKKLAWPAVVTSNHPSSKSNVAKATAKTMSTALRRHAAQAEPSNSKISATSIPTHVKSQWCAT